MNYLYYNIIIEIYYYKFINYNILNIIYISKCIIITTIIIIMNLLYMQFVCIHLKSNTLFSHIIMLLITL